MKRIKGQFVNIPGSYGTRVNGTIVSGPHYLAPGISTYKVHSGLIILEVQSRRIRTGSIQRKEIAA
jgi:hypothetical protein